MRGRLGISSKLAVRQSVSDICGTSMSIYRLCSFVASVLRRCSYFLISTKEYKEGFHLQIQAAHQAKCLDWFHLGFPVLLMYSVRMLARSEIVGAWRSVRLYK